MKMAKESRHVYVEKMRRMTGRSDCSLASLTLVQRYRLT